MTNEEYLNECRDGRDKAMIALKKMTSTTSEFEEVKIELRKMYALEIIAETLIKINDNFEKIMTDTEGRNSIRMI